MPTFTQSHYQRYKTDTTQFSTWLVKTAISLGYPTDALTPCDSEGEIPDDTKNSETRTAAQVRNAKKKARRKAKDRAEKEAKVARDHSQAPGKEEVDGKSDGTPTSASSKIPPSGSYALKVGQYILLATHLVDKQHPIPIEVIRILRRCIRLRQHATARFAASADPANGTHQHLVDALAEVMSLFSSAVISQDYPATGTDHIELTNRFDKLSIEDSLDEDEDDLADIQLPGISANDACQATLERSLDDAAILVIIFLEDVQALRTHIKSLWEDFKAGKVDLITAAITTDTALQLSIEPNMDLIKRTLRVFEGDMDAMLDATLTRLGLKLREVDTAITGSEPGSAIPHFSEVRDDATQRAYNFAHVPVIQTLRSLAPWVRAAVGVPDEQLGSRDDAESPATHSPLDRRGRWRQSRRLVVEAITDLAFLLGHGGIGQSRPSFLPFADGSSEHTPFSTRMLSFHTQRFLQDPRWDYMTVTALVIYLDINEVLGKYAAEGLRQLQRTSGQIAEGFRRGRTGEDRIFTEEGGSDPRNSDGWDEFHVKVEHGGISISSHTQTKCLLYGGPAVTFWSGIQPSVA